MEREELEKKIGSNSYPENMIEIDCVIFCFEEKSLKVLLVKNESDAATGTWKLPSDILKEGETILKTAQKVLKKYVPANDSFLEQLQAFASDSPISAREHISIGYYSLVRKDRRKNEDEDSNSNIIWTDIHSVKNLEEKHRLVLDFSIKELKKNICWSAVGFNLLQEKFTLLQVIHLYEEILGIKINKTNFRRKILQRKLVRSLEEKEEGVSYRAAKYYNLNVPTNEIFWNAKFNFNF